MSVTLWADDRRLSRKIILKHVVFQHIPQRKKTYIPDLLTKQKVISH